jgi:DNA polymerase alpha subunit B
MAESKENLNALFSPAGDGLPTDVLEVLQSAQRLYSLSAQELFYKWESYCLKMGAEETQLDLDTARMFQKDVQNALERNAQSKPNVRGSERKNVQATPRVQNSATNGGDVFGMLDEITPNALSRKSGSVKRKNEFETPAPRKVSKPTAKTLGEGLQGVPFSGRLNPGQVLETLNEHLAAAEPPIAPHAEPRVKVVANTDIKKFSYRPMSMRLSESSEVLDERIDDFISLIQKHHNLEDATFGNAAARSTNEIIAVGRIASDTAEAKLNAASLVLEMSRRMGAGLRVPLKVDALSSYQFFPGQIVALRGTNASGLYFTVKEVLSVPQLPLPVSTPAVIDVLNQKVEPTQPLNIIYASGPYTADDNLDFEPLQALCSQASDSGADALILTGPFLDIEHPLLASGDFDVPDIKSLDDASTTTLFRLWISSPLQKLCSANPNITIIMVPSVRDMTSKHTAWPQEQLTKKIELGLPKQVKLLPNPCFISLNEVVLGISTQDILFELSREQLSHGSGLPDLLTRLPGFVIEQRHFFPLYPPAARKGEATGACLDLGYLKLGKWLNVRPDVLVLPGLLTPCVKVSLFSYWLIEVFEDGSADVNRSLTRQCSSIREVCRRRKRRGRT